MRRTIMGVILALSLIGAAPALASQGGGGNDVIYGSSGNDVLTGGAGNDTIYSRGGVDIVRGGPGTDACWVSARDTVRSCEITVGLTDA